MHPTLDFCSYTDTSVENLFMHFFPGHEFPSHTMVNHISPSIIKFLDKNSEFICEYRYEPLENKKPEIDDEPFSGSFSIGGGASGINVRFYKDISITNEPLLYKTSENEDECCLSLVCKNSNRIRKLQEKLVKKFISNEDHDKNTYFGLLYKDSYGIKVKNLPLRSGPWDNLDIENNYGKEFLEVDNSIKNKLLKNNGGLVILHSSPGQGKSYYIKHLSKQLGSKKKFIFVPNYYIEALTSPDLIPLLLRQKDSVIVLEDAEVAVTSREEKTGNAGLVSSLLNLSDGVLSDLLSLNFIITFNTKKESIDPALLRPGRLLYEYEFKPLSIENSQKLIDKIGKKHIATKEMSLAEIYGIGNDTNHKEPEKIERFVGFCNKKE